MLKVHRPLLSSTLQTDLEQRQETLDQGQAGNEPWADFKNHEREQEKQNKTTIKNTLKAMFHGKCAYCERNDANQIEHYWPKAPHPQNKNRGTPTKMFDWENLLWACQTCNGFECKGSRMEWTASQQHKLLNPCNPNDDPLCYLSIEIENNQEDEANFTLGWLRSRPNLNEEQTDRAEYTIRRLKLNQRDYLRKDRAKMIRDVLGWLTVLSKLGPDRQAPDGYTIRQRLLDLLDVSTPHLAAIRQTLYVDSNYTYLKQTLLDQIPELTLALESWALPSTTCVESA